MSEVPHCQAGEATLDLRRQQEQSGCVAVWWLRAIELLHDEWRLLGKLGLVRTQLVLFSWSSACLRREKCSRAECYNFLLRMVGVVQW
jgi:hypothetical protein